MVYILLMLEELSEVEDLFLGAFSGSEPSLFFNNYLLSLGFKHIRDEFQHDIARVTDEAGGSVIFVELYAAYLWCIVISA